MGEKYIGVKYDPIKLGQLEDKSVDTEKIKNHWKKIRKVLDLTPKKMIYRGSGNISHRIDQGKNSFLISATTVDLSINLTYDSLTLVRRISDPKVEYFGNRLPSSESPMHGLLYQAFQEINLIFHLHPVNLQKLAKINFWPSTRREYQYGTFEIGPELVKLLEKKSIAVIRNHGIVICSEDYRDMILKIKSINYR